MFFIILYILAISIINLFLEKNFKEKFNYFYFALFFSGHYYITFYDKTYNELENKKLILLLFVFLFLYLLIISLSIIHKIYMKLKEYYHHEKRD